MKTEILVIYSLILGLTLQNCKSESGKLSETERKTLFYLLAPNTPQVKTSDTNGYQTIFANNCKTTNSPTKQILESNIEVGLIDDMIFSNLEITQSNSMRSAFKSGCSNLWDGGVIPFELSPTFSNISSLYAAFTAWENQTPVRFVKKMNYHRDYIYIVSSTGCSSYVGRIGGKQSVTLGTACSYKNILHELGHVIGFYHEHQRIDRDNFIIINTQNIQADRLSSFNKLFPNYTYSNRYDIHSIMHYNPFAFSVNSRPTITLRDQSSNFGNIGTISSIDVENTNSIYKNNFKMLNNIPSGSNR